MVCFPRDRIGPTGVQRTSERMDRSSLAIGDLPRIDEQLSSTIPIIDPVTEEQIGEISDGGAKAVDEAVARARASFEAALWHGKTPSERARILWKAADLLELRAEEIGAIDSRNVGKTLQQSRNVGKTLQQSRNVLAASVEQLRYFSGWCTKIYGKSADLKSPGGITGHAADLLGYTIKSRLAWPVRSSRGTGPPSTPSSSSLPH